MKKLTSFLAICLLSILPLSAGPFGLEMGMTADQVEQVCDSKPELKAPTLYLISPKKKYPAFVAYYAWIAPKAGLHYLRAVTEDVKSSVYGDGIKEQFQSIRDGLTTAYGQPKDFDYLREGSIWSDERYWMRSLVKKERVLQSYWTLENGAKVPPNIKGVELEALGATEESGWITLTYEFKNSADATKEKEAEDNSAF